MINDYYAVRNGETVGPFSHTELMEQGLEPDAQIFSPLTDVWQEAAELPEFANYFESKGIYMPTKANEANFWWRLLAFVIDYVIYLFLIMAISLAIDFLVLYMHAPDLFAYTEMSLPIVGFIMLSLYHTVFEATKPQGSIGKVVCKLKVVDGRGRRITFFNALGRNLGKVISSLLCGAGFLSIFWNSRSQAWHDEMAKTYVIRRGGN